MYVEIDEKTGCINFMCMKPDQVGVIELALSQVRMNDAKAYQQAQEVLTIIETLDQ